MINAVYSENSIIGSVIVDATLIQKLDGLPRECFTINENKEIMAAIDELHKKKIDLDIVTIADKLSEKASKIGYTYLSELVRGCECFAIDTHITTLKDKYIRREIIQNCSDLFQRLGNDEDINTAIHKFDEQMLKVLNKEKSNDGDNIKVICEELLDFLGNNDESGMKFGIKFLDEVIGGLYNGELTTIAAKSGVGKTALALQIALNCMEQGKKVLIVSREMSSKQVLMRNITKKTGISTKDMKNKELNEVQWREIMKIMEKFTSQNGVYINDSISTIGELKRRIRETKVDVVIIDYIQLMTPEGNMQNREREVATLSREIKNITLDYNIPIIQLSQLNDNLKDERPFGERPIRDSKAVFFDSNNVVYIHEPNVVELEDAANAIGKDKKSILALKKKGIKLVELITAKCRDGSTGTRYYLFNAARLHFQHIDY